MNIFITKSNVVNLIFALITALFIYYQWFGQPPDILNYELYYSLIDDGDLIQNFSRFEPGFKFISGIAKSLDFELLFYFSSLCFLTILIKLNSLFHVRCFSVYFAFFADFVFLHEFAQVRLSIALMFVFLAFNNYIQNNRSKILFYSLLAIFFHYSTLIFFVLFLIPKKYLIRIIDTEAKMIFLCLVVCISLKSCLLFLEYFNPLVFKYMESNEGNSVNLLSAKSIIAIILLSICLLDYRLFNYNAKFIVFIGALSVISKIILSEVPVFAHRLSEMLNISFLFIPYYLRGDSKRLYFIFLTLLSVYLFFRLFYLEPFFD